MINVLAGCRQLLRTAWRMDRARTIGSVVLMVCGAVAAPLLAVGLGEMTDAVVDGSWREAAWSGVLVAVLAIITLTFSHFAHVLYFELSELAEIDFDKKLIDLSNATVGIAHHERAEQADSLTVLQHESRRFRTGLEALLNGMGLALAMMVTAVLLARLHPLLLLLPLAAIPPLYTGRLAERRLDAAKTATAEPLRLSLNLFGLATSSRYAGEVRVFRLEDQLRRRRAELWTSTTRGLHRAQTAAAVIRVAGQLVFAAAYVGGVLLILRDAATGRHSVGAVVLAVALAAQVNQQVTMAVALMQDLHRMASAYRRMDHIRAEVTAPGTASAGSPPPERLREGIAFEGVEFAYPGSDTAALRDVDLTLPAGSIVAIVGENGAGKTTLVKLLCGFYQPTRGRLVVDGVDLRDLPIEAWRQRIAAGFQDFVRYELLARQAVGVGDLARIDDAVAVRAALERARAADVLTHLPDDLETQLGKSWADGAELSGGQWQKLALGRALMRQTPLLLVLDEPTSALDPEAEHALFERYAEQARRVGETTGAITVLVSHRFSTVRMADQIIVVRDGRIAEVGDHAHLIRAGGQYAELYALQARAYQ
ncbi:ABC transporter ATP-binding protein [Micromonospora sp. KC723]|uniref:ABC transporter ATP-binding protein n=1 Tax=Micromonospora sp. KC723 TaxID=2530381 RepID=UPI00104D3E4B|nr:ABC transporter ATP-binding protein [Micromonospora sp. KC723]TDB75478.1 ABC transporter ATP-binding protein [Micromonospora sp. KC723]